MTRLWRWIIFFWIISIGIPYGIPNHFFEIIHAPEFGDSTGYRLVSAVLFVVGLITLIRFLFKFNLPALVSGSTAMAAVLFIIGHIVLTSNDAIGLCIFAFALFFGLLVKRAGSLYAEDISATKESSSIHLSQAAEFLLVYVMMMMKLLPIQMLWGVWQSLQRVWHSLQPLLDQVRNDLFKLL